MVKPIPSEVGAGFESLVTKMTTEREAGLTQPPVSPLQGAIAGALAGLKSNLVLSGDDQVAARSVGDMSRSASPDLPG